MATIELHTLTAALTGALSPLLETLQTLAAQGIDTRARETARDARDAARDARETARDAREAARDARETVRDARETARFDALLHQGSAHTAALEELARGMATLQWHEGSLQRSPYAAVNRGEVGEKALALLASLGADHASTPSAGPAALSPALLASLPLASSEAALVQLLLPRLRELLGCGAAADPDPCARVLIDGQEHCWLDSLTQSLPSSSREKPDLFLVPAPCWSGKQSTGGGGGGGGVGALASRALQLDGCVREVLECKRGTGSFTNEDFGQLVSYLDRLPGPCRGALFNAEHLWLYEAQGGVPVRLVRTVWGEGGSAALLRDFFPPRRAEAALVTVLRDVMAVLGVAACAPGAAYLGAGATGRVFRVQPTAAAGRAVAAAAAAAAALQQGLALKVSSQAPQGALEVEFGTLAAAHARGAPVATVVADSCRSVFCRQSGRFLGGGFLLGEVLLPSPPISSLRRCRGAFAALAALHALGFPHGDARLPNLLQRRGSGELVWVDLRAPLPGAAAYAADREQLAASVLGARRGGAARAAVEAALDAAAEAQGGGAPRYHELAAAVYGALRPGG
jgi:hypothetical protein